MRYLYLNLFIALALMGCSDKPNLPDTKTQHGVPYQMLVDAEGPTAHIGDFVSVHLKYATNGDGAFHSTFGKPATLIAVQEVTRYGDQDEWYHLMSAGDSAVFYVIADSLYRVTAPPSFVESGEYVQVTVKVEDVMTAEAVKAAKLAKEKEKLEPELKDLRAWLEEQDIAYQESPAGVLYRVVSPGAGPEPQPGDRVRVHYTGKLLNGQVFDSSVERGVPYEFVVGKSSVIAGWHKGIPLFREGGKGVIYLAPSLAYGERGSGTIPPNSPLIFEIEIVDIVDPQAKTQLDLGLFKDYIQGHGWESAVKKTDENLLYVIHRQGSGPQPVSGQSVSVHYTGRLLSGQVFDSSKKRDKPITFILGQGRVIRGWDIGIGLLRPGGQATLFIPSNLAYGARGRPPVIPPNAPLIFDVELVKVR